MFKNLKKRILCVVLSGMMMIGAGGGFGREARAAETVTPMISTGYSHTVALKNAGTVWCLGEIVVDN